ncbi:electron transfer flavoprotein subunit beta/FixA family protein [Brucella haematophila]|uniref:Electron transfer flavoprotein subunit beta n=1 Tax=Brucella haematophila TaxID=419474 RepID=A0ABX1DW20_9HYPH|nr:electron transfer flavoprotein subunit beta/FixA family protein [Brucella haematophila]NKC04955.1 electron transfer flavoprotein subunit beta/FixA family protein [Brucella haematophila]TMV04517.1 electron transfer flavoprotein subunit beta/FixA family protein [Brucella haematophila]
MKVLVPVKRVIDYNVKVRVKPDGSGVDLANVKMSINPFDEIAVEEAIRHKEKGQIAEVILLSVGPGAAQEVLRAGLAMGADRAILVEADGGRSIEPLAVAKVIAAIAQREAVDLIIAGKQAIDDDLGSTAQMTAGLLNWPQATFASAVELLDSGVVVTREVDGGLQVLRMALPAVISADLRLNQPRYASLPNIMKAKKKPLDVIKAEDLGIDLSPRLEVLRVVEPAARKAGIRVSSVAELVSKLKDEAGVFR